MKNILTLLVVALFVLPASAQVPNAPNACPLCRVFSYVDTPAANIGVSLPLVGRSVTLDGWGLECTSGRAADRVEVFYSADDGFYKPVPWYLTALDTQIPRPDVAAAFVSLCPRVEAATGWHLTIQPGAIPAGIRVLRINVWRAPYFETSIRVLVVQ